MTLRRSRAVQAVMDLEDTAPTVLDERLPGSPIPFWMQVRTQFTNLLNEDELGDATIATTMSLARVFARLGRSLLPGRWDAAGWRSPRDLVFVVGGTTMRRRDDRAGNWLVDAYAEALPDRSLVVQNAALPSELGRPYFRPTRSLDPMLARAEVRVAFRRRRPSTTDLRVRELVAEFARLLELADDPRLAALADSAVWAERIRVHVDREFGRFLDRVRPRVLVFENAAYGGYYASLVAIARSRGVVVAEPQHGWIGPAHAAYNYGAAMHRPQNAVALPDVLLTFGEYWGEGLEFPGRILPVGKPYLEERASDAPNTVERSREVLVVSSVAAADATLRFLGELRAALPHDWTVRFRPHPSERAVLETRYPGLRDLDGFVIDDRADVYDSLLASPIVIGVASTVLFEAVALGCRIFVRDSPFLEVVMGDLFGSPLATADDVQRIVRVAADPDSTDDGRPGVDLAGLWRARATENFRRWFDTSTEHP